MADIYLVDGSSLVYRSFYAIRDLKTATGQPTNAIYGFTTTFLKILKEKKPDYMLIFFDLKGPTVRHEAFAEYKATRKPMPDELVVQLPEIKKVLKLLGIRFYEYQGYEADDLIASSSKKFRGSSNRIFIVTGDKDLLQLISSDIVVVNPADGSIMDEERFKTEYGVGPEKIPDIIGLAGDKSDNIPGLPGVGEKTALKLIKEFGCINEIFNNIDRVAPEKLKNKLKEGRETVFLGKNLGILIDDVPLEMSLQDAAVAPADIKGLLELFEKLEFRKLAESIKDKYFKNDANISSCENIIGFSPGGVFKYEDTKNDLRRFKSLFESEEVEKCGFNIKEKIIELERQSINLAMPFFDINVAMHLTGEVVEEEDIFACRDKYIESLENQGLKKLFEELEMPLVKTLARLEVNGIKIDLEFLNSLSGKFKNQLDVLQKKIYLSAGEEFNINSTRQLADILFKKLCLPPKRKTKTGFSTDNAVLKELLSVHPIAALILQYRETYKLKSTYIEGLIPYISKETGRIHPVYSQAATSTGRLSCSNPNLQNLPVKTELGSEIRRAFCADAPNILYSFDYSQIELRILAHFSEDAYLIEAFKKDKDIHQETADILFSRDSLFAPSTEVPAGKDARRAAKTINFGIIYGMGPYGLSQELNIALPAADNFIKEYFAKFKGVREYIGKTIKFVEERGYVATILKRRRYIQEVQSLDKKQKEFGRRAAINMPIQGSAADLIKAAMNRIYEYFVSEKLKSKLVLQVHDELLFEVVPEEEKSLCGNVKKIMEEVMHLKVPLKVDVKKGANYLDMKNL